MKYLLLLCCLLLAGCTITYRPPDVEDELVVQSEDWAHRPISQPEITTQMWYQRAYDIRWRGMDNMQQLWQLNQKYRPTIGDGITWRLR